MQIVIHAGAHMTDEDRLIHCLISNRDALADIGTNVPSPTNYRKLMRDLVQTAMTSGINADARDVILDAILDETVRDRIILSNFGFFGTPKMAVSAGTLYTALEPRLSIMQQVFEGSQVELFLAICNPATFLPALYLQSNANSFDAFMRGADPRVVRWSEMIQRVRTAFPDLPITIWCNEDLPLIWSEVIREMAGLDPNAPFKGEFRLLEEIMTKEGMARFLTYLEQQPFMSEAQKRRVIVAFMDKFAREDALEEELDVFGWTDELIEELTDIYDEDLYAIQSIPGIHLITP